MFNNHLQNNYFEFSQSMINSVFFLQVDRRRLQERSGDAGHSEELLQHHEAPQVRIAMMVQKKRKFYNLVKKKYILQNHRAQ